MCPILPTTKTFYVFFPMGHLRTLELLLQYFISDYNVIMWPCLVAFGGMFLLYNCVFIFFIFIQISAKLLTYIFLTTMKILCKWQVKLWEIHVSKTACKFNPIQIIVFFTLEFWDSTCMLSLNVSGFSFVFVLKFVKFYIHVYIYVSTYME